MRYLSLFSGIEAATSAWHRLGWECVGVCEVEPFCVQYLAHHYPTVPNLGDVTEITEEQTAALGHIDVIIFGSPCQDLSVAGKRKGFTHGNGDTTRSGLFFTALQIISWARKHNNLRFALWENVPGAFSSNNGRDFAAVVDNLAGMEATQPPPKGWGTEGCAVGSEAMVEWAVLDAQWFGVAQRRRRVFAIADFGDWANRPPILLEPESLRGDSAPSREAGQEVAGTLASRVGGGGFPGSDESCSGYVQPVSSVRRDDLRVLGVPEISHCLNAGGMGRIDYETETMIPVAHVDVVPTMRAGCPSGGAGHGARSGDNKDEYIVPVTYGIPGNWIGRKPENGGNAVEPMRDVAPCLTKTDRHGVALQTITGALNCSGGHAYPGTTLQDACADLMIVHPSMQVRRLTPRECERLQGFPDDQTLIPVKNKMAADGPRYKALGNSMAVPVIVHIGEKIEIARMFS